MAITRRQFIKRTGAVSAGTLLGPSLFSNPFLRKALAETIGDRYFVVVYLNGGNDGLNTVTPATNGGGNLRGAYDIARTSLNLSPGDLASTLVGTDPNTGAQLGLHPGLIGLKSLYDLGKLAVVQGCGYPEYNLSHEQSRIIWQTADPLSIGLNGGWIGRHLAANYGSSDIPGVNISDAVVGEFKQGQTSVVTFNRLVDFGFPYDNFGGGADDNAKRTAFLALCNAAIANAQPSVKYIGDSGSATLLGSEAYASVDGLYETDRGAIWTPQYDAVDHGLANDLREVAKVIYGVSTGHVNARFFQVSNGGYDTHSDQGAAETNGQHYNLHRELGDSLKVFYEDCADMGVAEKLCVIVWSEFSRRVEQNSNGTDHGSQAPMFIIGGGVNGGPSAPHGGVYGNHPNLEELDNQGNTIYRQGADDFRSTDFRDVYGTILKNWLNVPDPSVILPTDVPPVGYDPDLYWTAPNFDLGFL
jgi:uncharacterized protein (DUF1501 family)